MTTKNSATYLLTPPQRDAVVELARAYRYYSDSLNFPYDRKTMAEAARRMLAAQDAFALELIAIRDLQFHINRESEAA